MGFSLQTDRPLLTQKTGSPLQTTNKELLQTTQIVTIHKNIIAKSDVEIRGGTNKSGFIYMYNVCVPELQNLSLASVVLRKSRGVDLLGNVPGCVC